MASLKGTILITVAMLLAMCLAPIHANAQPQLPVAFYGTLKINGEDAEAGITVEARGDNVLIDMEAGNPINTQYEGWYGSEDPLEQKLVVQGDIGNIADDTIIEFYVEGVKADTYIDGAKVDEVVWNQDLRDQMVVKLDLEATITITPPAGGGGVGGADTRPPRIYNVSSDCGSITETTTDICWTTNEKSTSQVEYWSSPSEFSPLDTGLVIEHYVQLTNLIPGTTYHYRTMSEDRKGNLAISDDYIFTTLGEAPVAAFTSSGLSISLSEVNIGESVTISVLITNTGNAVGSYEVTLKINDIVEATKEVEDVAAGGSESVSFTISKGVAATYSVDVDGLKGSFRVKEEVVPPEEEVVPPEEEVVPPEEEVVPEAPEVKPAINWAVVGGIIAAVIVVGLLIFFLVVRRRAY